jgi:hypothetical protein
LGGETLLSRHATREAAHMGPFGPLGLSSQNFWCLNRQLAKIPDGWG